MRYIGIIFIVLLLSVIIVNGQVWTAPTQTPPAGNTNPPLHEGGTAQSKEGGLLIATGSVVNGLIVQNGNVGIGTITPGFKTHIMATDNNGLGVESSAAAGALSGAGIQGLVSVTPTAANQRLGFYTLGVRNASVNYNPIAIQGFSNQAFSLGSAQGAYLTLSTTPDGSATRAEVMRLSANGNVGIGLTSPAQKLDVNGYVKGTGVCIGADCRTSWPASSPTTPTGTISYCGINIYDINSTGSGWISYKYTLCEGYLPYESGGTDAGLGVPRGCPSGYFALRMQSSTGASVYTCMTGLSTHPSYSSPLAPRTAFGPF